MSRPRKPYGPNPPGRLPATMIKVLAAEMSDPGRLGRGKRYWTDDAVIDLVIGHGAVTAEVQGTRPAPYVVTIAARTGRGVPSRREVRVRCTCPDDDSADSACKHAVAALFALSDEVAIDPTVVERWRGTITAPAHGDLDADMDDDTADDGVDRSGWASVTQLRPRPRPWETAETEFERVGWGGPADSPEDDFDDHFDDHFDDDVSGGHTGSRLNRVVPLRRRPADTRPATPSDDDSRSDGGAGGGGRGGGRDDGGGARGGRGSRHAISDDPSVAQIVDMLHSPDLVGVPAFPVPTPLVHPRFADRLVDEVLASALTEFDIDWS